MAGLVGNVAWWAIAKQSGKGTAASLSGAANAVTPLIPFTGGSLSPTIETGNLSETDASRDQGVSYLVRTGVEGSPEAYLRDSYSHTILEAVLGTKGVSGTTNFTHSITANNTLPYYTIWRNQSDTLYERFTDCMVSEVTVKAEAGGPATISASVMGRTPEKLASNPTTGISPNVPTVVSDAVYNYNQAAITLGGSATSLVSSFELSISNNISVQQTDDVVPYDMVPGTREVNLSFDLIFEDLTQYSNFFYNGAAGAVSNSIFTQAATITLTRGTNNEIAFSIPSLAYEAFPVEPNPGGDPIVVSVRAQAQRSSSGIITATVKNQKSA